MRCWNFSLAVAMIVAAPVGAWAQEQPPQPSQEQETSEADDQPAQDDQARTEEAARVPDHTNQYVDLDTPINVLWRIPEARAILVRHFPAMPQYVNEFGTLSLHELAPQTQGAMDDTALAQVAAELSHVW